MKDVKVVIDGEFSQVIFSFPDDVSSAQLQLFATHVSAIAANSALLTILEEMVKKLS